MYYFQFTSGKSFVLLFCLLVFGGNTRGQDYQPTVLEGAKWVHVNTRALFSDDGSYVIELNGDTIIGGQTYKKAYQRTLYFDWVDRSLHFPEPPYNVSANRRLTMLVRENVETTRLYGIIPALSSGGNEELLLHDFSLGVGDTLKGAFFDTVDAPLVIQRIGQEECFGELRNFQGAERNYCEGVVSINYGLASGGAAIFTNDGTTVVIDHCVGTWSDCDINIIEPEGEPYRPLAIENANWVIWDRNFSAPMGGHRALSIRGDTLVEGTVYKKLYWRDYAPLDSTNFYNALPPYPVSRRLRLFALVRDDEEAKKVLCRFVDPPLAAEYPGEVIIQDFSAANSGDTISTQIWCAGQYVNEVQWIHLFGAVRKHQFGSVFSNPIVMGIGKIRGVKAGVFNVEYECDVPLSEGKILDYCVGSDRDCGFVLPVNTNHIDAGVTISIAPNPANEVLVLSGIPQGVKTVTIVNGAGLLIQQHQVTSVRTTLEVNTLPPGVYYCTFGPHLPAKKFIKR